MKLYRVSESGLEFNIVSEMSLCVLWILAAVTMPTSESKKYSKECSILSNEQRLTVNKQDSGVVTSSRNGDTYTPVGPNVNDSPSCNVVINACPQCYITLRVDALSNFDQFRCSSTNSQRSDECYAGCEYVEVYETDVAYKQQTRQVLTKKGMTFTSMSSSLKIVHCTTPFGVRMGKFKISFEIKDSSQDRYGSSARSDPNKYGEILSPNFPRDYALNDDEYVYSLKSYVVTDRVRVVFDDWELAPDSYIKVEEKPGNDIKTRWFARNKPPVYLSTSNQVTLTFVAVKGTRPCCGYVGFKASYLFVSDGDIDPLPSTGCSTQRDAETGGVITFRGEGELPGDGKAYDCVWILKQWQPNPAKTILASVSLRKGFGWISKAENRLEIRDGLSSASPLISLFSPSNVTEYAIFNTSQRGLFVRHRGTFYANDKVSIVYTAATHADGGVCGKWRFHCSNNWCIDSVHLCDGLNHCSDGSDETASKCDDSTMETNEQVTSSKSMHGKAKCYYCDGDNQCLPKSTVCDGKLDCPSGSDEFKCATAPIHRSTRTLLTSLNFIIVVFLTSVIT